MSTRNLRVYIEYARANGISVERLLEGLPITESRVVHGREWLDWGLFAEVVDRLEAIIGAERMPEVGRFIAGTEAAGPLRRVAGLAIDLRHIYRLGALWLLPLAVRPLKVNLEDLGNAGLRITIALPSHSRPSAAWLRTVHGSLEALPSIVGRPNARVDASIAPRLATYSVHLPLERQGLRQRLQDGLRRLLVHTELRELERQLTEIQAIDRERFQLEETLREQERLLSNLLRDLNAITYRCGARDYALLHVSGDSVPMTGLSPDEIAANPRGLDAIVFPEDLEALHSARRGSLGAHTPCTQEYRIQAADGSVRWVLDVSRGVYDAAGNPIALEGFIADVTERKRLEIEVQRAARSESIGRLAGGVAHDFNNMLTVITGFVELGSMSLDDPKQAGECFAEVGRAAERSAALTRQLLAFARKQQTKPQTINLNALLRGMEKLLRRTLMEDVMLRLELGDELWNVDVDPGQFEQVVLNLAINARDAMPQGGTLTIKTCNVIVDEPSVERAGLKLGAYVLVRVADSGHGMSAHVREHAFEPFFTTKDTDKGTGLGLAGTQGIVNQAGGRIVLESEPGRGTTFHIHLPRSTSRPSTLRPERRPKIDGTGGRVLLVEDHDALRDLFVRALEQHGFSVVAAASGRDALDRLQALQPAVDVLVTDLIMPVMSGSELVVRARRLCPALPVIVMSGYSEQPMGGTDDEQATTRFLAKPFTPARLAAEVRATLDATSREREDPGPMMH